MVDMNFKNRPEGQELDPHEADASGAQQGAGKKFDFSFFDNESEVLKPAAPKTVPPRGEKSPREENPFANQAELEEEREEPKDYGAFPKSRLIIILSILGVLLLALFIYLWMGPRSDDTTANKVATPTNIDTTPAPAEPANQLPDFVASRFAANRQQNMVALGYVDAFFNSSPASTTPALVVVTNRRMYLSVLADSRDAVAQFIQSVKRQNPQLQLKPEGTQIKLINGRRKTMADFSAVLTPPEGRGNPSAITSAGPAELSSAIRSVAQKQGARLDYLKQGRDETERNFKTTYYYANLSGSRKAINGFLRQLADEYPSVNLAKISLFPESLDRIDSGRVVARLQLILSVPSSI